MDEAGVGSEEEEPPPMAVELSVADSMLKLRPVWRARVYVCLSMSMRGGTSVKAWSGKGKPGGGGGRHTFAALLFLILFLLHLLLLLLLLAGGLRE
jgi:hypothetical protein